MRTVVVAMALVACSNKVEPPDYGAELAQLRAGGQACDARFLPDSRPPHWEEVPEYVAVRPTAQRLAGLDDPEMLDDLWPIAGQCGDVETLLIVGRSPAGSPAETRKACDESQEFRTANAPACWALLQVAAVCCLEPPCSLREACASACEWACPREQ